MMITMRLSGTKQGMYGETFTDKRFASKDNFLNLVLLINHLETNPFYETKIEIHDVTGATAEEMELYADWLNAHGYYWEWV